MFDWDAPRPYLEWIIVRFIPDANARSAAFAAGEIDFGGDTPVPRSEIEKLQSSTTLDVVSDSYAYLANQSQLVYNLDNPILAKVKVRHAIAHAIDLKWVLALAWYGQGVVSPTLITPALEAFHDSSIKPYAFDPEKAAALLDAAGYPLKDGKRFALRALHNPFADANAQAVAYVRQALEKISIEVNIQNLDFASYVKTVYTNRAFDIEIENLGNSFDPTLGVQRVYWSKNFKVGLGFSNGAHYGNPEVDRLLEAAVVEPDEAKWRQLWVAFQKIVADELPVLNLLSNYSYSVAKKTVRDHTLTIDGPRANFANVYFAA